eukprot:scaffold183996_cov58-Attheya_sp.AAC.3
MWRRYWDRTGGMLALLGGNTTRDSLKVARCIRRVHFAFGSSTFDEEGFDQEDRADADMIDE